MRKIDNVVTDDSSVHDNEHDAMNRKKTIIEKEPAWTSVRWELVLQYQPNKTRLKNISNNMVNQF